MAQGVCIQLRAIRPSYSICKPRYYDVYTFRIEYEMRIVNGKNKKRPVPRKSNTYRAARRNLRTVDTNWRRSLS